MDILGWLLHWVGKKIRFDLTGSGSIYFPNDQGEVQFSNSISFLDMPDNQGEVIISNDTGNIFVSNNTGRIRS